MAREADLETIILSLEAAEAWNGLANNVAAALRNLECLADKWLLLPDERARVNDDGTLTIFIRIPGVLECSLEVPSEHWAYRH